MKRGNDQSDLAGICLEWGPTRDINLEGANLYLETTSRNLRKHNGWKKRGQNDVIFVGFYS